MFFYASFYMHCKHTYSQMFLFQLYVSIKITDYFFYKIMEDLLEYINVCVLSLT
jgi:hypothetical protein